VTQTPNFVNNIFGVAYGNGLWVVGGTSGALRTSTDTVTWVTQNSNFGTTNVGDVFYENGLWFATGANGTLRTSTDTVTWVTQTSQFDTNQINSAAYGGGLWVAVGSGGKLRTSDTGSSTVVLPLISVNHALNAWIKK
jgi:hypothetical protein